MLIFISQKRVNYFIKTQRATLKSPFLGDQLSAIKVKTLEEKYETQEKNGCCFVGPSGAKLYEWFDNKDFSSRTPWITRNVTYRLNGAIDSAVNVTKLIATTHQCIKQELDGENKALSDFIFFN